MFANLRYVFEWISSGIFFRWLLLSISYFIDGYGYIPSRFLKFMFIVILTFAFLYSFIGIHDTGVGVLEINPHESNKIPDGISSMEHNNIIYKINKLEHSIDFSINSIKLFFTKRNILVKSFLNNLYFSLVVFSTLGLGDLYPDYGGRLIVGIEAIIGAISIAYFVSIMTTTRRRF